MAVRLPSRSQVRWLLITRNFISTPTVISYPAIGDVELFHRLPALMKLHGKAKKYEPAEQGACMDTNYCSTYQDSLRVDIFVYQRFNLEPRS
jgi:hypothetical protein